MIRDGQYETQEKASGDDVDSRDIKKHKLDVFRLLAIVDPRFSSNIPIQVRADLTQFLDRVSKESVDMKAVGLAKRTQEHAVNELREIYKIV